MALIDKKYYHNIDLDSNELKAGRIYNVTTSERTALASFFIANPTKDYDGYVVYDLTNYTLYIWNGSTNTWDTVGGSNGIPAGGTTGQILAKINSTDYNVQWIDNYTSQVKHEVKLGESINKGQAVYVSASNGTNMVVSKASNTSESTSSKTMGLLITSGVTNDFRYIITEGLLTGTGSEPLDTNSANVGDPVWLGINGDLIYGLTNKPYAPNHLVYIGVVTRKSATVGEIFVKIQNGFELKELHDVQAQSPSNKDTLYYDNTVSPALWKTGQISTILGYTPVNKAGDTMTGSLILNANPTAAYGAATKDYVDTLINGIDWKTSVNAATTTALPSYTVSGGGQTLTGTGPLGSIDSISLTANQRLLVKNETSTNTPNNGIYVVTQVNPFILTRANDANTSTLLAEATVSVAAGSTLSNTQWHCNPASTPITIGTTYITFAQIGSGIYTGSSPLSITGNVISIQDAAADGSTKGAATFTASDFNSASGVISIDYTNGQSASSSTKGFLTSTDWNTFNNKLSTAVTSITFSGTGLTPSTATSGIVSVSGTLNVSHGGTGAATLTGVVLGNGTSAMTTVGIIGGSDIQILKTNSAGSSYSFIDFKSLPPFNSTDQGLVPAATVGASPYFFLASDGTWQKIARFFDGGSRI